MKKLKEKNLIFIQIFVMFVMLLITLYFTYNINKICNEMERIKLFKNTEIMAVKNDIQNIYTHIMIVNDEILQCEAKIQKIKKDSPIVVQLYLKKIEALTETVNMHRRELKKWQETPKNQ